MMGIDGHDQEADQRVECIEILHTLCNNNNPFTIFSWIIDYDVYVCSTGLFWFRRNEIETDGIAFDLIVNRYAI